MVRLQGRVDQGYDSASSTAPLAKMYPDSAVRQPATLTASAFRLYEVNQECAPTFIFIGSNARPTERL